MFLQSPGVLAAVDATMHKAVGDRYKISGFPSLKYFVKGEEKYTLPQLRSKDKIIEFMHKWVMQFKISDRWWFPTLPDFWRFIKGSSDPFMVIFKQKEHLFI